MRRASNARAAGRTDGPILWAVVLMTGLPGLLDVYLRGPDRLFAHFAADAFYFFAVAKGILQWGFITIDGVHTVNGFHPLWQAVAAGLYLLMRGLGGGDLVYLYAVQIVCALSAAAAMGLMLLAMRRAWGRLPATVLVLPFGLYAAVQVAVQYGLGGPAPAGHHTEGTFPLYGTFWSYINAMESPMVLLGAGLLGWTVSRKDPFASWGRALLLGLACAMVLFARLDHAFFPAALLGLWGIAVLLQLDPARIFRYAAAGAVFALLLAAYLAVNHLYAGSALPISGTFKSSFPGVTEANMQFLHPESLRHYKVLHMVLPPVFAVLWLLYAAWLFVPRLVRRDLEFDASQRFDLFLTAMAGGTCALFLYNFFFVFLPHQGQWYYPLSTWAVSLYFVRWTRPLHVPAVSRVQWAAAGAGSLVLAGLFVASQTADYHARFAHFFLREAPLMKAHYGEDPPKLLSYDDGLVAFATGYPTMSATHLMLDHEAAERILAGEGLFEVALDRGFDRYTTGIYILWEEVPMAEGRRLDQQEFRDPPFPAPLHREPLFDALEFTWDYAAPSGRFGVLRFRLPEERQ